MNNMDAAETAATDPAPAGAVAAPKGGAIEGIDVWDYFAEQIDDFAAAKTIVDHFDAYPQQLLNKEVDLLGLYLRAKLTLKRQQIAYRQAEEAIHKAREQSRSLMGVTRAALAFVKSVVSAVKSDPAPIALVAILAYFAFTR